MNWKIIYFRTRLLKPCNVIAKYKHIHARSCDFDKSYKNINKPQM